ncbi:pyruvate:ferredoxin (flavodoxin) oxidoreductase [Traorella massiliensis]|uniref:pyruvate:ferredoxin (flavodoxin) oxidoreductase n=1 Tax=Traorella massiliensis TaxID=1903263 RepID=UPI0008F926A5|nr:pyruvate:ferredoxin (flavodoxin) oxidoreductase [Traorella massiliensis]
MTKKFMSMDGNNAAAHCAYAFTEVAAIYPITPSSTMAEVVDAWATQGRKNIFDSVVKVVEMQSEGGAAGAVHGALQGGALSTTFTASQGLLLMIPNIYKMVGECLPGVIHVAARAIAGRALNIFGDHEDIYACRQTGICMLASHSVQEAMDLGGVAHLSAIKAHAPFIHFFDGFRTSHEIQKVEVMDYEVFDRLLDREALASYKANALNPHSNPVTRGGAENDDIFFQGREAQNEHYAKVPDIVAEYMKEISKVTGREYAPFTYYGAEDADRIIVAMGSVTETIKETIDTLVANGEKVGLIKVHLYRPFSTKYLSAVLPSTVKKIAVLDRTKEMGGREPLYLDVLNALKDRKELTITGGRYGLGSKDTAPNQIKAVYDELAKDAPKDEFTIGINDDVTHLSLPVDKDFEVKTDYTSCLFYGLGSDGTVSANKNSIKIIGDHTDQYVQAYFAYDSKKAGGVTRSHLRFGKSPIRSTYYINNADFISCSLDAYVFKYDMVSNLKKGGTFLLNTTFPKEELESHLPNRLLATLAKKQAKFYIIDATKIAQEIGMGRRTNTILQSAFFALNTQIMPYDEAVTLMKEAAKKSYSKKGEDIVLANYKAIDSGKDGLVEIPVKPEWADLKYDSGRKPIGDEYFDNHVAPINHLEGYDLPVSAFTKYNLLDGSIRNNVAYEERRTIAVQVPTWEPDNCIQCGFCSYVCPHGTIRPFLLTEDEVKNAPMEFKTIKAMGKGVENLQYRIQVSPDNCVGCGLCVTECPGKAGNKALKMVDVNAKLDQVPLADYLYKHTPYKTQYFSTDTVKGSQFMMPYFEVSGACPGCGETPYYKLVSQLFGKDMMVANATGCSMIYSSSTPSTPFVNDENGNGVAWANSLFEDNAEYGYGMALAQNFKEARILKIMEDNMESVEPELKDAFTKYIEAGNNRDAQRELVEPIMSGVKASANEAVKELVDYERDLVGKSIWIVGGDGWAYDIGYGGLDHVLANNLNVNILVLDTEVYSNTGGQSSKSSQASSIAKFAAGGKATAKKDLGQIAMAYGHVYVASISMGANKAQTLKALKEAESYDGPSLIIAYSPCAEHGIKGGLSNHQKSQAKAVECGYVTLYRYDPRKEQPLTIDSKAPNFDEFNNFLMSETRYSQLPKVKGETTAYEMFEKTKKDAMKRYDRLVKLSQE